MVKIFKGLFVVATFLLSLPVIALTYELNPHSDIVGEVQTVTVKKGDTLHSIARRYDMGLLEMQEANPKANPNKLKVGTQLIVPTQFILPPGPREGVVINLAELRVYYYPAGENIVMTFPVGVGRLGWRTPIGETKIIRKRENPTWTPPDSIRAYSAAKGVDLPEVVPAGPNNPLGLFAMNLGWTNYLMHGTNQPSSVGVRSSSGCIRMYPEDIETLFKNVEVGTKVTVVYEPYKLGTRGGKLYLEAHELFPENYYNINHLDKFELLQQEVQQTNYPGAIYINWETAKKLIDQTHGIPVDITGAI